MLFDLRGRGRQRTVRVIYLGLALLMGGGLVLFGIGSSGTGGLLNGLTGGSSSAKSSKQVFQEKADAATKAIQLNRRNAGAWATLTQAEYQIGVDQSNINADGQSLKPAGTAALKQADNAWTHYLALAGDKPDPNIAQLMITAYSVLAQDDKAVSAAEIVAEARPNVGSYTNYAEIAYSANQSRVGDLAAAKAESLATKDQRAGVKTTLASAKTQAQQAALQKAQQGATGATSSVPLTPGGAGG